MWFTAPVSRCSMKFQVRMPAYAGSAYGTRNSVRIALRPLNGGCSATAAAIPRHQDSTDGDQREDDRDAERLQQPFTDGVVEVDRDLVVASDPAHGAADQFAMKNFVSFTKLIQMPTSIGMMWISSSSSTAGASSR